MSRSRLPVEGSSAAFGSLEDADTSSMGVVLPDPFPLDLEDSTDLGIPMHSSSGENSATNTHSPYYTRRRAAQTLGKAAANGPHLNRKHTDETLSLGSLAQASNYASSASESTGTVSTATSTQAIPGFVSKLYRMLSDPTMSALITWSADGQSFIVVNPEDFARHVLPHFFKHNNFSSFVRQLNMYGFHKVPNLQQGSMAAAATGLAGGNESVALPLTIWEFAHQSFLRDRPDLLASIRRKINKEDLPSPAPSVPANTIPNGTAAAVISPFSSSARASAARPLSPGNAASGDDLNRTMEVLRQELRALRQQQSALRSDLQSIHRDNQLLWSENLASRERHSQQQHVIDRILRFLASIFTTTPDGRIANAAGGIGGLSALIGGSGSGLGVQSTAAIPLKVPSSAKAAHSVTGLGMSSASTKKRPLMLLEDAYSASPKPPAPSPIVSLDEQEDFRRQVMELIESNQGASLAAPPTAPSPVTQQLHRIQDLQVTTNDIANDISLVDDELDALASKSTANGQDLEDDFDFSNYLNVPSLE